MPTAHQRRLAIIYPSMTEFGGGERYLINLIAGLGAREYAVTLFTADYDEAMYPPPQGWTLHRIGGRGFMEGLAGTRRNGRLLADLLHDFDLVIAGSFPAHVWAAWHKLDIPMIWLCFEPKRNLYPRVMYAEAPQFGAHRYRTLQDYHGIRGLWRLIRHDPHVLFPYWLRAALQRTLDRRAVGRMRAVLAISPYIAEKVKRLYHPEIVRVVWSPVPAVASNDSPFERVILCPTRLEPIKNVGVLVRAAAALGDALDGWQIVIVGSGSQESALRQQVEQMQLGGMIQFTGRISDAELAAYYAQCAFVVYPALAEPFGLPCAEAGAFSKAVVAAGRGGTADIILHEQTGLTVDMHSAAALAAAMQRLMNNPAFAHTLGCAAQKRIHALMALPNWIVQFEEVLWSTLT